MPAEFEALYSERHLELIELKKAHHWQLFVMESALHKAKFVFLSVEISICAETFHTFIEWLCNTLFKAEKYYFFIRR